MVRAFCPLHGTPCSTKSPKRARSNSPLPQQSVPVRGPQKSGGEGRTAGGERRDEARAGREEVMVRAFCPLHGTPCSTKSPREPARTLPSRSRACQ
eukprot:8808450-Pyramimonas_sp.AAC.1